MTLALDRINSSLNTVSNTVNVNELQNAFQSAISNYLSIYQSDGKEVGDTIQGFEVIADEGLSILKETLAPIVGRLSEGAGISLKTASSRKSDISAMTGQSVDDGFLHSTVSSVNAIGINNTLSLLSGDKSGISKIISSVAGGNVSDVLLNAVSPEGVARDAITQALTVSNNTSDLVTFIQEVTGVDNLTNAVTGDTNILSAIEKNLTTSIKAKELSSPVIVNNVKDFNDDFTPNDYEFSYVNTVEELMLEFRNSERAFSQIIVDYTSEYLDENKDASTFQSSTVGGIPYHYIVRKDGRIQRGRPLDIESSSYGNSVVVAIPGGYDTPKPVGEDAYKKVNSSTTTSWYWFNTLLDVAYTMFPGIQVYPSTELKEIGWDSEVYIASLFGKKNNVEQSNSSTRSQLVSTRLV
jgi:hypothetical protein